MPSLGESLHCHEIADALVTFMCPKFFFKLELLFFRIRAKPRFHGTPT
jgi:hypothetical protein